MGGSKPAAQAAAQEAPVVKEPPKKKGRGGYFGIDPKASYGSRAPLSDGTNRNTFVTGGG